MKIVLGYPSLPETEHLGRPQVAQNRQFQYFNEGTHIYPVVMAYAATMLRNAGHDVYWLDGPAENYTWQEYLAELWHIDPDLIAWEVKTPTVKRVWPLVDEVKDVLDARVALLGDHITALPTESMQACDVDFCMQGGDYDFSLVKLAENLSMNNQFGVTTPRQIINYGTNHKLDALPVIDRELTKWRNYAFHNGNYKYLPGAYTYFGRDCWWRQGGGCTFCSWTNTYKNFRVMSVDQAMDEVEACARLGVREIFDDTGTFPAGAWLHDFCERMIKFNGGKRHGKARITMGCNMRPGALKESDWKAMGAAGFRFILFGLESANQSTLDRINKGQADGAIEESCRLATKHGMHPHATCMVGYPWESREDATRTIELTRDLFRKGWIQTLQATIVIPYPGTELYRQCEENNWLLTRNWNNFDMRGPVMRTPMGSEEVLSMTRGIYKSCVTPSYIARKLASIRTVDDLQFLWRAGKYFIGHLKDFAGKQPAIH